MKKALFFLLLLVSAAALAQTTPEAATDQAGSFPETQPDTIKLTSPGFTLYVDYASDGRSPETHEVWSLNFYTWSKKQVAIGGHCEDKEHKGIQKMLMMNGTPFEGDNYVLMHAVILVGDKQDERDFVLTWDPDDMRWDF